MRRRILAVLVALALAAVGCVSVVAYVRAADQRALAGREATWVLLATKRIPAGTTAAQLRAGRYLERVAMPAAAVPKDALATLDAEVDGLALTADVQSRQMLLRGMLGEPTGLSGGLALPEGRLAVSVEVTAAARVGGYVRPGSRIAIFDTFTLRTGGRTPSGDVGVTSRHEYNHATRVLLPRVEVIAVGERGTAGAVTSATGASPATAAMGKGGATILVTVAVTQQEAERLVHATQTGSLYLALLDDTAKIEPGSGVDNTTLFP